MTNDHLPLSYIEISRKNLIHNIRQLKDLAKKGTRFSVAIKGNAYGHGQNEIAKILEPYVDYFQVDGIEELELLRQVTNKQTLVLGYVQETDIAKLINHHCILSIFSVKQLRKVNRVAKKLNLKQEIHISVDAFLGREGFLYSELPAVFKEINKCRSIKLSGIYAHFANLEDTKNFSHAQKQINEYGRALRLAGKFNFKNLQTHISSTAGLLVYEKNLGINPLIRLGVGIYGMWPSEDLRYQNSNLSLKPVLTWKTKIAQIKILPENYPIGYGLTYRTVKENKIAIIPQGYADGLDRRSSNNGFVLIKGTKCKILGRIMMNMFAVDINHLKKVTIEEEVVILGRQEKKEITAEKIAVEIGTINYEVTTHISSLLPRYVV